MVNWLISLSLVKSYHCTYFSSLCSNQEQNPQLLIESALDFIYKFTKKKAGSSSKEGHRDRSLYCDEVF